MFVCVENDKVIGIQEYEPAVPDSVKVYEITEEEYTSIIDGDMIFNVKKKKVTEPLAKDIKEKEAQAVIQDARKFLNSTDWKVMRHIREIALNMKTSLTEEEYMKLERDRHMAAAKIK